MTVSRAFPVFASFAFVGLAACSDDGGSPSVDAAADVVSTDATVDASGDVADAVGDAREDAPDGDLVDAADASEDVVSDATLDAPDAADTDPMDASDASDGTDASDALDTDGAVDVPDVPACVPALEITNGVDDDCDELVDEEPIEDTFRNSGGTVLVGPGLEVAAATGFVRFEDRRTPELGEGTVRLFGTDGTIEGATATIVDGELALSVPYAAIDPLVLNPATLAVDVRVQLGSDTFVGEILFELSVLPARVAVSSVDGTVYVSGPASVKPRSGNSLYMGTSFDARFGPDEEIEPGVWRMNGDAAPDFSTAPNLFYFTTGRHTETGAEAYFYDYGERQEEDGVVWWPAEVGVEPAPRIYFFPEDTLEAILARDLEALP